LIDNPNINTTSSPGQIESGSNISQVHPILITGAHRTGTTWVGKMLTASGQAAYISEPLNVLHRPGVMLKPVRYWYTYICSENEGEYFSSLSDTLRFRYYTWEEIKSLRSPKGLLRMGRDWSSFLSSRLLEKRPLLKDPFAVFSAPWFSNKLSCAVVITIRHPAAFVSSLKRLNWPFNFTELLSQPLLMRDWLESFRSDMEKLRNKPDEIINTSSMLWRVIYSVVKEFQEQHPEIRIVRHEDLSANPLLGFQKLYDDLDLEFSARVRHAITDSSNTDNPKELRRTKKHSVNLDSRSNIANWKHRLDSNEISQIRDLTEDLYTSFYPDIAWDL